MASIRATGWLNRIRQSALGKGTHWTRIPIAGPGKVPGSVNGRRAEWQIANRLGDRENVYSLPDSCVIGSACWHGTWCLIVARLHDSGRNHRSSSLIRSCCFCPRQLSARQTSKAFRTARLCIAANCKSRGVGRDRNELKGSTDPGIWPSRMQVFVPVMPIIDIAIFRDSLSERNGPERRNRAVRSPENLRNCLQPLHGQFTGYNRNRNRQCSGGSAKLGYERSGAAGRGAGT